MKKTWLLAGFLAGVLLLAGCGQAKEQGPGPGLAEASAAQQMQTTPPLRIVDGAGTESLVLAGKEAEEVYTLSIKELEIFLDGQPAGPEALQDGMAAEIEYDGPVLYTFPMTLSGPKRLSVTSSAAEQADGRPDLCGVYLEALEQLWNSDTNEGIQQVAVDLSQAPGSLTDGEKAAVAWAFGSRHGVEGFCATREELEADGLLTPFAPDTELLQWENGALFSITAVAPRGCIAPGPSPQTEEGCTPAPQGSGLRVLELDALKWRSPRGAVYLKNNVVTWDDKGSWSFTPGALAMS